MHRIDTANNVGGLFADPDPIHGQGPVVADSAWLNDIQENIMAVLTAASIVGVKGTSTQLRDAIKQLVSQGLGHAVDTGAANAYVITPSPALGAYGEGNAYTVHFTNTNTGASTINVSGLGAKAIVREDGTALQAGDIVAGEEALIIYDGASFKLQAEIPALATTLVAGIVALATAAQTQALTDTTHAVTPAGLGALLASTTQKGILATATDAQAAAEALSNVALVPSNLAALFANSASSFGYQKLPGGLIVQWGFQGMGDDTLTTFTLPTTFASGCYVLVGGVQSASAITAGNGGGFIGNILSTSQVAIGQAWSNSSAGTGVWFIAIGK